MDTVLAQKNIYTAEEFLKKKKQKTWFVWTVRKKMSRDFPGGPPVRLRAPDAGGLDLILVREPDPTYHN